MNPHFIFVFFLLMGAFSVFQGVLDKRNPYLRIRFSYKLKAAATPETMKIYSERLYKSQIITGIIVLLSSVAVYFIDNVKILFILLLIPLVVNNIYIQVQEKVIVQKIPVIKILLQVGLAVLFIYILNRVSLFNM